MVSRVARFSRTSVTVRLHVRCVERLHERHAITPTASRTVSPAGRVRLGYESRYLGRVEAHWKLTSHQGNFCQRHSPFDSPLRGRQRLREEGHATAAAVSIAGWPPRARDRPDYFPRINPGE